MTGSWYRTPEVTAALRNSPNGELSPAQKSIYLDAERAAIRDQEGLYEVSPGEQRVLGYTSYLPNRFDGFSATERAAMNMPPALITEFMESNPALAQQLGNLGEIFTLPKLVAPLKFRGATQAKLAASDAVRIAKDEGAPSVFLPAASPGVTTIFYPNNPNVYPTHLDYLNAAAVEFKKEYEAILSVPGVILQIDAPDLAMSRQLAQDWDMDFYDALPHHVDAINNATEGLDRDRIRVHYCYGNYNASHINDADFRKVLPEILNLKCKMIVGEMANPRHEGDILAIEDYLENNDWPKNLKFAAGVIDVKTPIVETPDTVQLRLNALGALIGDNNTWGGTDCGFETFAGFDNTPRAVGLQKLRALVDGANQSGAKW